MCVLSIFFFIFRQVAGLRVDFILILLSMADSRQHDLKARTIRINFELNQFLFHMIFYLLFIHAIFIDELYFWIEIFWLQLLF